MPKNLDAKLAELPAKRRARVQARAAELSTLRDLRLAAQRTQQDVAQALGVRQDTVSRLEQRSDILLSTMRRYVQAMGGSLDIVVKFPNRPQIKLDSFAKAHTIES